MNVIAKYLNSWRLANEKQIFIASSLTLGPKFLCALFDSHRRNKMRENIDVIDKHWLRIFIITGKNKDMINVYPRQYW